MSDEKGKAARIAVFVYTGISLLAAFAFFLAASLLDKYSASAIYGGAVWVFLLTMIVTMPIVIPAVKQRLRW